jgi:GNAT superfamily N-acetyltransferase
MNRTQVERASGGATAAIRPARPADLPALRDFFAGLSMQTRYLRFFSPVTPGPALLDLLSGGAGTTDALVATRGRVIVGHAMASDRGDTCDSRRTDGGVVVADAWQGQGVGSALVRALIIGAQARGVTSVVMDVLPGNRQVVAMIKGHWPGARTGRSGDYDTICVRLPMASGTARRYDPPAPVRGGQLSRQQHVAFEDPGIAFEDPGIAFEDPGIYARPRTPSRQSVSHAS